MTTKIERDFEMDGDRFALAIRSRHEGVEAITVVHRQDFERRIGGTRIVEAGTLRETAHLAAGMTWKSAGAGIGVDGMKCLLVLGERAAHAPDRGRRVAALRAHARIVAEVDPGVIFGPDMGSPASFMAEVGEDSALLSHLTGLPLDRGGLDINALGLTAHGVHEAIRVGWEGPPGRVSIQGFGAVGGYLAGLLRSEGWKVVALSNRLGTLESADGLDIPGLQAAWTAGGDAQVMRFGSGRARRSHDPGRLLSLPTDLFVPAARTAAFACGGELTEVRETENPEAMDIVEVREKTGLRLLAEAANHPLTPAAEARLVESGVPVLPDVLVNCGGFIGCWLEWVARNWPKRLSEYGGHSAGEGATARRSASELGALCVERTREEVRRNVERYLARSGTPRERADHLVREARERLLGEPVRG